MTDRQTDRYRHVKQDPEDEQSLPASHAKTIAQLMTQLGGDQGHCLPGLKDAAYAGSFCVVFTSGAVQC